MELKEVFEEAKNGRELSDIIELDLEKAKCATLDGLPSELPEINTLSASSLGLTNLNGLPQMPKLHTFDLSENKLKGEALKELATKCPALEQLNLCGNEIATLDDLKTVAEIKTLLTLDLYENEITQVKGYRDEVFKLIPTLRYLDGYDVNNEEIEVDDDSGAEDDSISGVEDEDESGVEDVGLSYLDSSKCLEEEDDSADFQEKPRKRKAEDAAAGDAPQQKQSKDE